MLKFNIKLLSNFTQKENLKLKKCKRLLVLVCNDSRFKDEILDADFSGETSHFKNCSNLEIYLHIMSGKETLLPEIDNEADISLKYFTPNVFNNSTVGYTYVTVLTQWINRNYLRFQSFVKVASNILHEWGHKLGFDHDFKPTRRRKFSICYQLNRIFEKLATDYIDQVEKEFDNYETKRQLVRYFRWYKPWTWF